MRLTSKLLDFVYRALSADPDAFLAMRLRYAGEMSWSVSDGVLKTEVEGGPGVSLSVGLAAHTFKSLVGYLAAQPGYSVPFLDAGAADLSALALLDGSGNQDASNGDHLSAYRSLLYAYLEPVAVELQEARRQVANALEQMNLKTADAEWLDEWGGYFGVARKFGETDAVYSERIIFEILRPRGNNKAIEIALASSFKYPAQIVDAPMVTKITHWIANGSVSADGSKKAGPVQIDHYGEFDAVVGFDLMSSDSITDLMEKIREVIDGFRDAGTRLRQVAIDGKIEDVAASSSDATTVSASVDVGGDNFPAVRILADGSIVAGSVSRVFCDGSVIANGMTSAAAFGVTSGGTMAGLSVDPMLVTASTQLVDSVGSPLFSDGLVMANGEFIASGFREKGIDDAFIFVRRLMTANGRHRVGDGTPTAAGLFMANGADMCGAGAISVNRFAESEFRLM